VTGSLYQLVSRRLVSAAAQRTAPHAAAADHWLRPSLVSATQYPVVSGCTACRWGQVPICYSLFSRLPSVTWPWPCCPFSVRMSHIDMGRSGSYPGTRPWLCFRKIWNTWTPQLHQRTVSQVLFFFLKNSLVPGYRWKSLRKPTPDVQLTHKETLEVT
jgi:hypothetical protein